MKSFILGLCVYFIMGSYAHAQTFPVLSGECRDTSHIAEGEIGTDLTKRESRFFCDSLIINNISGDKNHFMLQFSEKESHHLPILAFSGYTTDDKSIIKLEHIYFQPGIPTIVSDGWCRFFFDGAALKDLMCGAKVDETGRRTVAIVEFQLKK